MKSLIIKDLYNISHSAKTALFVLVFMAFAIIPSTGAPGFIAVSTVMCSTMVISTFSFDDYSGWNKYALIMPVSRKNVVEAKFIVLIILSVVGCLLGTIVGFLGGLATGELSFIAGDIKDILIFSPISLLIVLSMGSLSIALVFKYGAEKGRIMVILSTCVPVALGFGIYKLALYMGMVFTDRLFFIMEWMAPVAVLIWITAMYRISCRIFSGQEV